MNRRQTSRLTRSFRITRLVIHTVYGLFIAALILPRVDGPRRNRFISRWCSELLTVLNIRVVAHDPPPDHHLTGVMFVANHVSWADIHALNSVHAVRFVAKSEIRGWPVFGWLAQQANTLFTERSRRHEAGRMVETTADSLRAGDCICFFPEGTTTDGTELKPFKSSLLQAAIDAGALIWPVAIRYPHADGSANLAMAYCNDMTLLQSMKQVLAERAPVIELRFAPPIAAAGLERRELSLLARQAIAQQLGLG